MINGFLQFIKKLSLAVRLARFDLLFLIENLPAFKKEHVLARPFIIRNSLPPIERIYAFLASENNDFLYALAEELSLRGDIFPMMVFRPFQAQEEGAKGNVILKKTSNLNDVAFYMRLLKELSLTSDAMAEVTEAMKKRLDLLFDMRLYAAELEALSEYVADSGGDKLFEIDWQNCTKHHLHLNFFREYHNKQKLSEKEQNNLAALFGHLLYNHSVYPSYWRGVFVDSKGNIAIADFDGLHSVDAELKNFINCKRAPTTEKEYRMQRALTLLKEYCPKVDFNEKWSLFEERKNVCSDSSAHQKQLLDQLHKHGIVSKYSKELDLPKAEDLAYLFDSKRHMRDPRFLKSSFRYWGPLFIAIYLLSKYF